MSLKLFFQLCCGVDRCRSVDGKGMERPLLQMVSWQCPLRGDETAIPEFLIGALNQKREQNPRKLWGEYSVLPTIQGHGTGSQSRFECIFISVCTLGSVGILRAPRQ